MKKLNHERSTSSSVEDSLVALFIVKNVWLISSDLWWT